MLSYLIRRLLYAVPIVLGVMLITFLLFYVVQSPRGMALRVLGPKASTQAIDNWLRNRGYDKPRFINTAPGASLLDSQFFHHVKALALFDFGKSDATGEPISTLFRRGAIPSLLITVPAFAAGLTLCVGFALFLVFVRDSPLDLGGIFVCVAMMSVPIIVYVIFCQWLIAVAWGWLPAFGFIIDGLSTARFLALPVVVMVIAGLGGSVRLYRAIFLEEIRQDYVRTAQAKGASNGRLLLVHVLKNGMIALLTLVVTSLPFLVMGSLVIENFFGIPGLGNLAINAVRTADFAVVRAVVYLGTLLYIVALILTDISYAAVDPRVRLS